MAEEKDSQKDLGTISEMPCGCICQKAYYIRQDKAAFNIVHCRLHARARRMADALSAVRLYLSGEDYHDGARLEEFKAMIDEVLFGIEAEGRPTRSVPK